MGESDSKKSLIKQVFANMSYGLETESILEATDWLSSRDNRFFACKSQDDKPSGEKVALRNAFNEEFLCDIYIADSSLIDEILNTVFYNTWLDLAPIKRAGIISKFAAGIEKKQDLIAQLELAARGILSRDTKNKALGLLTDSLQFYSSLSIKCNVENATFKPKGLVVAVLSDSNALSALGYVLGGCLASGHQLVLQTPPKLTPSVALLIEIASQAGVPEGSIRLIPGEADLSTFLVSPEVSLIVIFDDLYREKYLVANNFSKKIIFFNSLGSSMMVFANCDLDAAVHSIIDAAFAYRGMLPWSVRKILVQESIFETFLHKLKGIIKQIKIGKGNEKNIDITYPEDVHELAKQIEKAKSSGLDVYQPNPDKPFPAFLIEGVSPNNVIRENPNVPIVAIVSFRSINEGVALANNSRHGLGVSVWSESTSLINEIIEKLKFGTIWINSHGHFAPNLATSPYRTSGNGFFGGKEGFYEYIQMGSLSAEEITPVGRTDEMEKAISEAKKAQASWFKLGRFQRHKTLQLAAQAIHANSWDLPEDWINEWIQQTHEYIIQSNESFSRFRSFNIWSIREACGVVAVETPKSEGHNKRVIIAALSEGNTVIILNSSDKTLAFYTYLSKALPKGVLTVIAHSAEAVKVAALHKELDVFIGVQKSKVFSSLPLKSSTKFRMAENNWISAQNKVTLIKNIWFNKGESVL